VKRVLGLAARATGGGESQVEGQEPSQPSGRKGADEAPNFRGKDAGDQTGDRIARRAGRARVPRESFSRGGGGREQGSRVLLLLSRGRARLAVPLFVVGGQSAAPLLVTLYPL